jgi:hypothetical protein
MRITVHLVLELAMALIFRKTAVVVLSGTSLAFTGVSLAGGCAASSGAERASLLELYTSEGCDSCPPADQWLSTFKSQANVVPMAYHVDYWDYIGWKDRFASPKFSERQRLRVHAQGSRAVYTPQVMINGRDARWRDIGARVPRAASDLHATTTLKVEAQRSGDALRVDVRSEGARPAKIMIAITENGLLSDVKAGENRGVVLRHDFVVRALAGPFAPGATQLKLPTDVVATNASIAVWAEDAAGALLQAMQLPLAGC